MQYKNTFFVKEEKVSGYTLTGIDDLLYRAGFCNKSI